MGIKELVNAFNLNNYGVGNVNTNFTVEGKKIVGLFASGTNTKEYLREIGEEIIEEHYPSGIEVASRYYNLNCFPFVSGANPDKEDLGNGIMKVKLADSMDPAVIHNLKIHFANEFEGAVGGKVVARLQKAGVTKEEAYEWIRGTVGTGAIGKPYLYCMAFSDEYLKRKYDSETFEVLKGMYIQEFNSRLEACGLKRSDFYEYKDDMLYIKDVSDKVVRSVAEYVKGRVALYLGTSGTEDPKVENLKDLLGDFIFKLIGKSINAYEYDIVTDKKKIENGNDFVLIPLTKRYSGQLESLKHKDAYKVNIIHKDFISDIRGMTAKPDVASCENPVYAISNKGIAQLLPEIMQSPIAYSERNGRFEFAVDPENFKRRGSSRSSSTVTSPIHAGPSGLRTPPNQRKADTDSGYDSNSPPKPKDSVAHSSSSDPRSSFEEIQEPQSCFPRRGVLPHNVGAAEVGAAANMPAWTSASFQPMDRWSLPVFYAQSSDISVPRFQPPTQLSSSGASSWKGANPVGTNPWSQPMGGWSSQSSNLKEDCKKICEDFEEAYEKIVSDSSLSKEEQELFKALLYTLNLTNYTFDGVYTNFFAKDGKIVSFLHENVDREKYLQAVRDYIIEKYCETEEEARKVYDLDEFPFKLNYEEKQGKTVVANISSGALSNLKILFSQKFGKNVDAIDISAVKKVEKREKDEWVDRQESKGCALKDACISCFPDEGVMKQISITFDKEDDEYLLNRSHDICEVRLLYKMQQRAKDTSKAGKGKPEDNKDSGCSSGFVTDAENVSSKAEATTSGYESMDCENTERNPLNRKSSSSEGSSSKSSRSGSSNSSPKSDGENTGGTLQKRKVKSPVGGDSPAKRSLKSENSNSSSEEAGDSPHPGLSGPTLEQVREQLSKTGISKW